MEDKEQLLVDWVEGKLSQAEVQRLHTYYDAESLATLKSQLAGFAVDTMPVDGQWAQLQPKIAAPRSALSWRYIAIVFAVLVAAGLAWQYFTTSDKIRIENKERAVRMVALPDGVEVHLAPAASIAYDPVAYSQHRRVQLEGHAYFDVSVKGAFTVVAGELEVSVLGTEFDIWPLEVGGRRVTQVQCIEGSVQVQDMDSSIVLVAGEQVLGTDADTKQSIRGPGAGWLTRRLVFDGVGLTAIYRELSTYYGVSFVGDLQDEAFSGTLPTDNLENVLNTLSVVTGNTYIQKGQRIQITAK